MIRGNESALSRQAEGSSDTGSGVSPAKVGEARLFGSRAPSITTSPENSLAPGDRAPIATMPPRTIVATRRYVGIEMGLRQFTTIVDRLPLEKLPRLGQIACGRARYS